MCCIIVISLAIYWPKAFLYLQSFIRVYIWHVNVNGNHEKLPSVITFCVVNKIKLFLLKYEQFISYIGLYFIRLTNKESPMLLS